MEASRNHKDPERGVGLCGPGVQFPLERNQAFSSRKPSQLPSDGLAPALGSSPTPTPSVLTTSLVLTVQYLSSPLECQLLEDKLLIWPGTSVAPALSSRQYLLSTCYLGAPGVGCGDTGGNQTDTSLSSGADSSTQGLFVEPLFGFA